MGNATSWLAQAFCPEDQVVWFASKIGDVTTLRLALERMTPENRCYLEWKDAVFGCTPLAIAAYEGRAECVQELLAVGANTQARDAKGQTPLHIATKKKHGDVVRLLLECPTTDIFARTTVRQQTALDIARHQYAHAHDTARELVYCIDILEQKLGIYSGWLFQRTDNLLSIASGLTALHSWKHRYCTVLRTSDPAVVEIDLFAMRPGEKRPPCPAIEMVYRATDPLRYGEDATWFNKKEHRFALTGYTKAGINRVSAPEVFEFACENQRELAAWKAFFANLRASVGSSATTQAPAPAPLATAAGPLHVGLSPSPYQMQQSQAQPLPAVAPSTQFDEHYSAPSGYPAPAPSGYPAPARSGASSPLPSAPDWESELTPQPVVADDGVEIVQRMESAGDLAGRDLPPMRRTSVLEDGTECVICFDGPKTAVLVPCGHNATCMACAEQLVRTTQQCPVCRGHVREVVKIYRV